VPVLPLTLFVDAFFCTRFDFRCFVALEEKGLDYAVSRVMMTEGQGLSPTYKELSLTARVPGMVHGDFWLAESQAIVEYLEDVFPPPAWPRLYPADPRVRARARQVVSFLGSDLNELARERPSWMVAYPASPPPLSPVARAEADELITLATRLVESGALDAWSIASADLTFALLRLARTGEVLPPTLQALIDANLARPSVRRYLGHERPPNPPQTGRRTMV
jgi:glutathione S-transferase